MSSSISASRRGELNELNEELNSTKFEKKKEAIKRVIAHMTVGKDVSSLFQSVIKCLEMQNIEMKKLVYLYIINYSRTRPDDAIMVINLFKRSFSKLFQDAANQASPLIRALAVRTMGCLRVKKLNEYLGEPLSKALDDEDPYVRKTAILCVPKVYELNPDVVEHNRMIEKLQKMLQKENNAIVISNIVIALRELQELKGESLIEIDKETLNRLLLAVNETIEWGQIFILDHLVNYAPKDSKEAENIIERVLPRLSHINTAVVLATAKVIIKMLDNIQNNDYIKTILKKLSPPIVSMLSGPPEQTYVVLRNINFILQRRPHLLDKDVKVFFCNFNDPYYVKLEKLEIITKLCDSKNYEVVLNELFEYSSQFDTDFVRRAIKAIGKVAIKVDKSVEQYYYILLIKLIEYRSAINILMNLFKEAGKNNPNVLQEVTTVMAHIFRKFPTKWNYQNSLNEIVANIADIIEPESKASVVWMIGEYADKINQSDEFMDSITDGFLQEDIIVQLQILTAAVKVFLKLPNSSQEMITKVLQTATDNVENPDIRDRAYIYWRMLSSDPEKTKKVVLGERPPIIDDQSNYPNTLLEKLILNIGNISSLYHKAPESIFQKHFEPAQKVEQEELDDEILTGNQNVSTPAHKEKIIFQPVENQNQTQNTKKDVDLLDLDFDSGPVSNGPVKESNPIQSIPQSNNNKNQQGGLLDLLGDFPQTVGGNQNLFQPHSGLNGGGDLLDLGFSTTSQNANNNNNNDDLFSEQVTKSTAHIPYENVLNENTPGFNSGATGLAVDAAFTRENSKIYLDLRITNKTGQNINNIEIILRPNFFSLSLDSSNQYSVKAAGQQQLRITINTQGPFNQQVPSTPLMFSLTLKSSLDLYVFNVPCLLSVLLNEDGLLSKEEFRRIWKEIAESNELMFDMPSIKPENRELDQIKKLFAKNNIFYIASRMNNANQRIIYFSSKASNGIVFLTELSIPSQKYPEGCSISCKCQNQSLISLFLQSTSFILSYSQ